MKEFFNACVLFYAVAVSFYLYLKYLDKKDREDKRSDIEKRVDARLRKDSIIARAYMYDYEEDICEIFSKTAKLSGSRWTCSSDSSLPKEDIVKQLASLRSITLLESEKIVDVLIKHGSLFETYHGERYYPIVLDPSDKSWDCINLEDLNIDKWMKRHEN